MTENPDEVRDHLPSLCEQCGGSFSLDAERDLIGEYDEIEIPPVKPYVVRHRRLACRCGRCGLEAKAPAPAVATSTPFGPRIHALAIYYKMDNLSTHTTAALYQSLPPAEGRRLARRLEFHYTPKHASWLNMVEIEIGILRTQCLARRIPTREALEAEIDAWEAERNAVAQRIEWMFTIEKARTKLAKAYPKLTDNRARDTS